MELHCREGMSGSTIQDGMIPLGRSGGSGDSWLACVRVVGFLGDIQERDDTPRADRVKDGHVCEHVSADPLL